MVAGNAHGVGMALESVLMRHAVDCECAHLGFIARSPSYGLPAENRSSETIVGVKFSVRLTRFKPHESAITQARPNTSDSGLNALVGHPVGGQVTHAR